MSSILVKSQVKSTLLQWMIELDRLRSSQQTQNLWILSPDFRLEKYVNMNFTGFHKILKKHDRLVLTNDSDVQCMVLIWLQIWWSWLKINSYHICLQWDPFLDTSASCVFYVATIHYTNNYVTCTLPTPPYQFGQTLTEPLQGLLHCTSAWPVLG